MRLELVTGPEAEPVGLDEAKDQQKVSVTTDDDLIEGWIEASRRDAERILDRALITQTWRLNLDAFPAGDLVFPRPPLQSVSSVKYTDDDGIEQTVATSVYTVDTSGVQGRLYLAYDQTWPSDVRAIPNAVRVEFVCGYGDEPSDVPFQFRAWILNRVGDHNAHREGTVVGTIATRLPHVDGLLLGERVGL